MSRCGKCGARSRGDSVCPIVRFGIACEPGARGGRAEGAEDALCHTEYYINRSFAAVGRMLQNHTGPIFPLLEDLFGISRNQAAGRAVRDLLKANTELEGVVRIR